MPHPKRPIFRNCALCGKQIRTRSSRNIYCKSCAHFLVREYFAKFSPQAQESIRKYVRKHGFTCDFSGVSLDLKNFSNAWYCDFSCPDKRDRDKMVLVAAIFAIMKGRLTEDEFWYYVLQLHDNRTKHTQIKKRPIINWPRLISGGCCICGAPKASNHSVFCANCSKLNHRMKRLRLSDKAIQAVWDYIRKYGYVCYYTGMPLELNDPRSPWYLTFDHYNPRNADKMVITSALVNAMKMDLTESEFWGLIAQLANHYRFGKPVIKKEFKYWSRKVIPMPFSLPI